MIKKIIFSFAVVIYSQNLLAKHYIETTEKNCNMSQIPNINITEKESKATVTLEEGKTITEKVFDVKTKTYEGRFHKFSAIPEVNLVKGDRYKHENNWSVTNVDEDLKNRLADDAKDLLKQYDLFRIKNFSVNWAQMQIEEVVRPEGSETIYKADIYVRLRYSNEESMIDQGSLLVVGRMVLVKNIRKSSVFIDFYDESSGLEELGHFLVSKITKDGLVDELALKDSLALQIIVQPILEMLINDSKIKNQLIERANIELNRSNCNQGVCL